MIFLATPLMAVTWPRWRLPTILSPSTAPAQHPTLKALVCLVSQQRRPEWFDALIRVPWAPIKYSDWN